LGATIEFNRLCGVKRHPFETLLEELRAAERAKTKRGRPCKLSLEDQLLMPLGYWRESRPLFQLGMPRGMSEGTVSQRVRWVEDTLIGSGRVALPKRTERFAGGSPGPFRVVVVEATETPVERPKKN